MQIHEFSTGIQVERTSDGGWVSKGFTGDYMNKTLSTIPPALRDAITNREFSVGEGGHGNEPATIGRVVSGYGEEWSVVAVITKEKDDRGRRASLYRYFLAEGRGQLENILAWMNEEKQQGRRIIFDPFQPKRVGQPNEYRPKSRTGFQLREDLEALLSESAPAIVPAGVRCMPLSLNEMAKQMAHYNGGSIAWAFKVEALEQPRMFQVIQPGSDRAEDLLRRALASQPRLTTPIAGEQAIKNAVKGLIRKVKPEALLVLDNALGNPAIDERFWEGIFNGQGADKARSQGLYSEQMVKLLTLRGMILPETLPEFVQWMGARSGKQEEHWEICSQFQSEILIESNQLLQLRNCRENVVRGVRSLIPRVINKPELVSAVVWFLASPHRIWGYWYKEKVRDEIDNDLSLMSQFVRQNNNNLDFQTTQDQSWKKLLEDIAIFWQIQANPRKKFEPLADLFSQLRNPKIAALFYQFCFHFVPKKIVVELRSRGYHSEVYGIHIDREIGILEQLSKIIIKLGEIIMPLPYVIFLMIVMLSGGFLTGRIFPYSRTSNKEDTKIVIETSPPPSSQNTPSFDSNTSTNSPNPQPTLEKQDTVNKNQISIQTMIDELEKYMKINRKKGEERIIEILDPSSQLSISNMEQQKQQWEQAIKNYQIKIFSPSRPELLDGIIEYDKKTYRVLKCEVVDSLGLQLAQRYQICQKVLGSGWSTPATIQVPQNDSNENPNLPPQG